MKNTFFEVHRDDYDADGNMVDSHCVEVKLTYNDAVEYAKTLTPLDKDEKISVWEIDSSTDDLVDSWDIK